MDIYLYIHGVKIFHAGLKRKKEIVNCLLRKRAV